MKIELACGQMFEGTLEEYRALKVSNPELFVAPTTVANGDGSSKPTVTETEKQMFREGMYFVNLQSSYFAELGRVAFHQGREDFSDFESKEKKAIKDAMRRDGIEALIIADNAKYGTEYTYDQLYKSYEYYRKVRDAKKKK